MKRVIFLIVFCLVVAGCSNEQVYNAVKANSRTECEKYNDDELVRQKCIENASKSYDDYKKEIDSVEK